MVIRRVAVTGATGFVGAAIADHLAEQGMCVTRVGRLASTSARRPVDVAIGDLTGRIAWDRVFEGVDAVVHAAAIAHPPADFDRSLLFRINADATAEIAAAVHRCGASRLIFISSVRAVCGPTSDAVVTDETPAQPVDDYGSSKLMAEEAALAIGPDAIVLRPVVVHGAGARDNMGRLARYAASPWPLPLGGAKGLRSIVSDRNLASAAAHMLSVKVGSNRRFLVSDTAPLNVPTILTIMRAGLGRRPNVVSLPSFAMGIAAVMPGSRAFVERLNRSLVVGCGSLEATGWRPEEASAEGLVRTVTSLSRARACKPSR